MLTVVKIGGKILEDAQAQKEFCTQFAQIPSPKILIHGGGRTATTIAEKLGVETQMIEGRRVTSTEMLEVAVMVYAGLTNKSIVANLQALKCQAIGLCGADLDLIRAEKRPTEATNYGWVGDVKKVNAQALQSLLNLGSTPVIAPLTHDGKGQLLNTNADTIASEIASSLTDYEEVRLIFVFEKKGVLENIEDENSYFETLSYAQYQAQKQAGSIHEGMIPKLDNGFATLQKGVKEVIIGQLPKDNDIEKMIGTRLELSV